MTFHGCGEVIEPAAEVDTATDKTDEDEDLVWRNSK